MRSTPDFHNVPNYSNKSFIVNNPVTFDKFHLKISLPLKPVILNMV